MSNKHPSKMGPPEESYMVLTEDGPEYFDELEEAREEAERAVEDYVLAGEISNAKRVLLTKVIAYGAYVGDEDEESIGDEDDFDSYADVNDYELLDVEDDDISQHRVH